MFSRSAASVHFARPAVRHLSDDAPPAILELGTSNGFDLMLQDRSGLGHEQLMAAVLGTRDANLRRIEQQFAKVRISARGNEVRISGDDTTEDAAPADESTTTVTTTADTTGSPGEASTSTT